MAAQANKTGTSKNTTNEKEKMTVTHVALNSHTNTYIVLLLRCLYICCCCCW